MFVPRGPRPPEYRNLPKYARHAAKPTRDAPVQLVVSEKSLYLKGISAEFQVIRGFSQKIPADSLSYDKIHS